MKNTTILLLIILAASPITAANRDGILQLQDTIPSSSFHLPEIPSILSHPEERCTYLLEHFWDHYAFRDTTLIHRPGISEQAFSDFISVFPHAKEKVIKNATLRLMKQAESSPQMFFYFANLAEKYLYDANSPLHNEEWYIPFLQAILSSTVPTTIDKIRPQYQLEWALKNRTGNPATDFSYISSDGNLSSLYQTSGEYLLLIFYDPTCEHCHEITRKLQYSSCLQHQSQSHKLRILSIDTESGNTDLWKKGIRQFPTHWITGYDKNKKILNQGLYDLKAMPSLYLLDKNKKIILKDTSLPVLENFFKSE